MSEITAKYKARLDRLVKEEKRRNATTQADKLKELVKVAS